MLTGNLLRKNKPGTNAGLLLALVFFFSGSFWLGYTIFNRLPEPEILFLAADEAGTTQLFRVKLDGTAVTQLTKSRDSVTGYAPSPNGREIAFTTSPTDLGRETIWLMKSNGRSLQQLLTCPDAVCHHLVWAPDGRRLLYERHDLDATGIPAQPRLWWLDTTGLATEPALADDRVSAAARFSPDGQWLAYYSAPDAGVWVYNFTDGRARFVTSELGAPVVWHPDGQSLLYTAFSPVDWEVGEDEHSDEEHRHVNMAVHLFLLDLSSGRSQKLSADVVIEDSVPAWAPDGQQIAFGRRQMRTDAGRQIWQMSADGVNEFPLTADPSLNAGPPQWSPDGRYLLFQRFNQSLPQSHPGVWLLEVASGQIREIVPAGFLPSFLPARLP